MGWLSERKKRPQRYIPNPTGPYNVGCTDIMTATDSPFSSIFCRLFYPAYPTKNAKSPEWLPHDSYLQGYAMFLKIWPPLFCKYFPKFVGDVHIPAAWDALPVHEEGKKFPVVIFSHGLGGCRTSYTTLCLELASHGFVVAALEHRDYSACMTFFYEKDQCDGVAENEENLVKSQYGVHKRNHYKKQWMLFRKVKQGKGEYAVRNKQVHQRAKECSLALDLLQSLNKGEPVENILGSSCLPLKYFRGILDVNKASVGGHSFGGATAIAALASDRRFRVGIGLDTWMLPLREDSSTFQKVSQPILFINMEKFQTKSNLQIMKKVLSTKADRTVLTLKGTVHLNQSDMPFLCDKTMRKLFGAHSRMNRFTAMDITTRLAIVYLAKYLDQSPLTKHLTFLQAHEAYIEEGIK